MFLYNTNIQLIHIETYVQKIKDICDSKFGIYDYYHFITNVHQRVKQLIESGEIDENLEIIKEFENIMEVVQEKQKKELFYSAFEDGRRKHPFKPVPWVSHHPQTFASRIY